MTRAELRQKFQTQLTSEFKPLDLFEILMERTEQPKRRRIRTFIVGKWNTFKSKLIIEFRLKFIIEELWAERKIELLDNKYNKYRLTRYGKRELARGTF